MRSKQGHGSQRVARPQEGRRKRHHSLTAAVDKRGSAPAPRLRRRVTFPRKAIPELATVDSPAKPAHLYRTCDER
jgi:hypothetical protein